MVQKTQNMRPIFGEDVRNKLRVDLADGPDHRDALETSGPMPSDVGIYLSEKRLI